MLYDPKREQKTETKPSLAGFISWLEQQDPQARYSYLPCEACAIGQYLTAIGSSYKNYELGPIDNVFRLLAWNAQITEPMPRTFGGALKRARACLRT